MYFSNIFLTCTPPSLLFSSPPSDQLPNIPQSAQSQSQLLLFHIALPTIWSLFLSFGCLCWSKHRCIKYCRRICGHSAIFFLWINVVKLHQNMCFVCSLSFHLNINLKWLFKTHDRIVNETFLLGVTCTRNLTRLGSWWSLGPLDQVHVGLAD